MAGGFYQQNRPSGVPGFGDTGDAAPAGTAKPTAETGETAAVTGPNTGNNASSFERGGGSGANSQPMTLPKQFAGLAGSNPKIASAVTAFNALPPAGKATLNTIGSFVAQNPAQTQNVVGNLQDVLDGKIVIPNLAFAGAETTAQTGVVQGEAGGNSTAPASATSGDTGTGGTGGTGGSKGSVNGDTAGNSTTTGGVTSESSGNSGAGFVTGEAGGNLGTGSVTGEAGGNDQTMSLSSMGVLGGGSGIPPGADIEELAFVVLMSATNDQDNDLQEIMNEVQAQTKAKQFLRQQMQVVNTDVANNSSQQVTNANGGPMVPLPPFPSPINPSFYSSFQMPNAGDSGVNYYNVDLTSGQPLNSISQLKGIQQDLQGDLDSMNEMSEMTSMRLQMAMDRRSKFVETLSNVLKKIDETSDAIVQNMK